MINHLLSELKNASSPEKAKILQKFFKTGKGEYGEGDIFLGVTVPETRKIAKKHINLSFDEITKLLKSKIHEERLAALLLLVEKYNKSNDKAKDKIVNFYLSNTKYVNNWDLVDLSAHQLLGSFIEDKDKSILTKLAKSPSLWERRIAIISTYHFIKNKNHKPTFKIAEILLEDKHDLIQKAVGWMLREVGKRNQNAEEEFLKYHYKKMPRTMLRYAIERFDKEKRDNYLKGKI
ncbi:DNA alkylation repair protein [Candidatus Pacearchaeota archaeon]|nr:DNA alkylation repair protein [Candidatus Pacearchaeota archaeon]